MDHQSSCSPADDGPRLLSHGSVGHVTLCGCGHLHLTLQYLTLRFEPDAFRELAALLAFAQRRLDAEAHAHPADLGDAVRRPTH